MAESIQNIFKARALRGTRPQSSAQIIEWLEQVASCWNQAPFIWGEKRAARRSRAREKHHHLAGSGSVTRKPIRRSRAA